MSDNLADWIQEELAGIEFVTWDRFVTGEWPDGRDYATIYGWIDRDDEYKDFVEITFWEDKARWFTTSSAERTEDIYECLFDEPLEEHNDCKRVENAADIDNVVEL